MTTDFRAAILATIAYHDVLGLPLTRFEIGRYLVCVDGGKLPKVIARSEIPHFVRDEATPRIAAPPSGARNDDSGVGIALESLQREKNLACVNGFWCLPGREHLVAERIEKHKLAEIKWKILQRWGRMLAYVPFVRLVLASGSLVFHNTHEGSDLDVLIITKYGRIWTSRALATGLVGLFGRRRHGAKIKDRICFNHFLTDQSLCMPYPSLYNAVTYSRLTALFELGVTHAQFLAANDWISEHLVHQPVAGLASWKMMRRPFGSASVQRFGEWLLAGRLGNRLEQRLKAVQRRRIEADPRSFEPGGRVVADDTQLEFHPASPEIGVLAAYRERLKALGLERLVSRA